MHSLPERFAVWFSTAVGAMDAATGAALVAAPATTLSLFGAQLPPGDDTSMRFVGAFVCAVGLTYLFASIPWRRNERAARIEQVWWSTAIIRTVVALFVAGCIVTGRLEMPWATVAAADAGVAGVQLWWLKKGRQT